MNLDTSFLITDIDYLITVNIENEILRDASILVIDGQIAEINPANPPSGIATYSGKDRIIMPGLINAHSHLAMTLLRGYAEGVDLDGFLKRVWQAEAAIMTPETVVIGTKLGAAEALLGGTTSVLDMYFHPAAAHAGAIAAGLRHVNGPIFFDFPALDGMEWEQRISFAREWPEIHKSLGGPETPIYLMPHSTYTDSPEHLSEVAQLATELNANIHLHVSETENENRVVAQAQQKTPTEVCADTGLLQHLVTFGHGVHLSAADIAIAASNQAVVAHCPGSNLKLASGVAEITAYDQAGLTVALGTDGCSSSNDLNMWPVLRLAANLIALNQGPDQVNLEKLLRHATIDGAAAIGMRERVGSIEVGKFADLIAIDLTALHLTPIHNILALLFFAVDKADVIDVWVAGERVVKDRALTKVDAAPLRIDVQRAVASL